MRLNALATPFPEFLNFKLKKDIESLSQKVQ